MFFADEALNLGCMCFDHVVEREILSEIGSGIKIFETKIAPGIDMTLAESKWSIGTPIEP